MAIKGKFNPDTRRKIAISYGIYNPMVSDAFTRLQGRRTSESEKKRFINYFICSSLFDDFTDCQLITEKELGVISFNPNQHEPGSFDERAFLQAHKRLRDFVTDKVRYDQVSRHLFAAQLESKKQFESCLNRDELQQITFDKGGNSVLLCYFYLDGEASEMESHCWYRLGTMIQLINDLFDIYKDLQDRINTLPNMIKDIYVFERFFIAQIDEMKRLIAQLPYSVRHRRSFSLSMAGIYAFGLIAIHRLKKIQGTAAELPDLRTLPRKSLVIDMEEINNLAKWFKFAYRHAKWSGTQE